jgi:predicted nucleotide-binding protein (sugar kinase/HSP70/actin superfamily)
MVGALASFKKQFKAMNMSGSMRLDSTPELINDLIDLMRDMNKNRLTGFTYSVINSEGSSIVISTVNSEELYQLGLKACPIHQKHHAKDEKLKNKKSTQQK